MESGIYKIRNILNEHYYIGGSINLSRRWSRHQSRLNGQSHENPHLQRAWNKYGNSSFVFEIEEWCGVDDVEQSYLNEHAGRPECYNIALVVTAPMRWRTHKKETKRKISTSLIGHVVTKETCQKIREALKGRKLSNETRNKMKGRIPWNKGSEGFLKSRIRGSNGRFIKKEK